MTLDLPRLSPAAPALLARLAGGLPVAVPWPGTALRLALEPDATAPEGWACCAGRLGEGRFTLALDPALLDAELASRWPGEAIPTLPRGLAEVLLEALLAPWLDRLEAWLGRRPVIEPAETAPPHALGARDEAGALRAVLRLDDTAARRLAAALPPAEPVPADPPLRLDVLLDRQWLPAALWARAAPGDVLLLDAGPAPGPDGEKSWAVRLAAGRMAWRARLAAGQLTITARMEAELDPPKPADDASLDDIPILVEAVLGELTLPLSRLRDLAPGAVLELGPEALRSLALRVAGRQVARAELVMIGDRPGLRLLARDGTEAA